MFVVKDGLRRWNSFSFLSVVFIGNFVFLLLRGWSGLDRIPSDPNYAAIVSRLDGRSLSLIATTPYFHLDTPSLATLIGVFPISWHALVGNMLTHVFWALSATTVSFTLARFGINKWMAVVAGLTLVFSPWASQSSLGNYGGIRWPILVAVLVYVSVELLKESPRPRNALVATLIASICTPISFSLLIPITMGSLRTIGANRRVCLVASIPPMAILLLNVSLTEGNGYGDKVSTFWNDVSTFWITGQLVPGLLALVGISLTATSSAALDVFQRLYLLIFVGSFSIVLSSFLLGGIADRYFVAPASLTSIGLLLGSIHIRNSPRWRVAASAFLFSVIFLIPAIKWFELSPWLDDGPTWTSQVEEAHTACSNGQVDQVQLVTSDGKTPTSPISCSLITRQP